MIPKLSGIYEIKNLKNDRVYIGSSKQMASRVNYHKRSLRRGCHDNRHLQNSWNKYGEDYFLFRVIEECDIEVLLDRERYWIYEKSSHLRECGYNIDIPMSEGSERRDRSRNEDNRKSRHVLKCNLRGEIESGWIKICDVVDEGWRWKNVQAACSGERGGYYKGHLWCYGEEWGPWIVDDYNRYKLDKSRKLSKSVVCYRKLSGKSRKKSNGTKRESLIEYEGKFLSIKEASEWLSMRGMRGNLSKIGKRINEITDKDIEYGGFIWKGS